MRAECEVTGHKERWRVFQARVLSPLLDNVEPVEYEELVEECGFTSPAQASNALITAKRSFNRILREVVAEYARDTEEVEEELRQLMLSLSQRQK